MQSYATPTQQLGNQLSAATQNFAPAAPALTPMNAPTSYAAPTGYAAPSTSTALVPGGYAASNGGTASTALVQANNATALAPVPTTTVYNGVPSYSRNDPKRPRMEIGRIFIKPPEKRKPSDPLKSSTEYFSFACHYNLGTDAQQVLTKLRFEGPAMWFNSGIHQTEKGKWKINGLFDWDDPTHVELEGFLGETHFRICQYVNSYRSVPGLGMGDFQDKLNSEKEREKSVLPLYVKWDNDLGKTNRDLGKDTYLSLALYKGISKKNQKPYESAFRMKEGGTTRIVRWEELSGMAIKVVPIIEVFWLYTQGSGAKIWPQLYMSEGTLIDVKPVQAKTDQEATLDRYESQMEGLGDKMRSLAVGSTAPPSSLSNKLANLGAQVASGTLPSTTGQMYASPKLPPAMAPPSQQYPPHGAAVQQSTAQMPSVNNGVAPPIPALPPTQGSI